MTFDIKKFGATRFKDRTEKVPVPDLKTFFKLKKNEKPVWVVKGLSAPELAIVNNAVDANKGKSALIEAIASGTNKEKVDAIRKTMNIIKVSDNIPDDLVRRHQTLVMGSVDPVCSEEMAVKLGLSFPVVLYALSQKIYALTGQGQVGE